MSTLRRRARRGFTLVETMIATAVFTMGILGVYMMMLKSYELVTLARHRDNGRALLLSFADQFLRLQTTDLVAGTGVITRPLFANAPTPTGYGLSWTDSAGNTVSGLISDPYLPVTLGESGSSQVRAQITRTVNFLDAATGTTVSGATTTAAGWMLQATFTITYSIRGRPQTQSLTVARSVR